MTAAGSSTIQDIYGPFEAGFSATQDNILATLGCTSGFGYVDGGVDTKLAEAIVAHDCSVTLPRTDSGGSYISLLDQCGGHTQEYHFHERLSCLYSNVAGHSAKIGEAGSGQGLYGAWFRSPPSGPAS